MIGYSRICFGVPKIVSVRYSFCLHLGPIPLLGRVQIPDRTKAFLSLLFVAFLVIIIPSFVCITHTIIIIIINLFNISALRQHTYGAHDIHKHLSDSWVVGLIVN